MDWHGILQSLLSRVLWELILIVGGGTVIAVVKAKWPRYAPAVLYGLGGAACLAIVCFALTGQPILSEQTRQVTPDNVESFLKPWLDDFQLSTRRFSDPNLIFGLVVTLPNNDPINIGRPHNLDRFLVFRGLITISPEHLTIIEKMDKAETEQLKENLSMELARTKLSYALSDPLKTIMIESRIPITSSLSEDEVIKKIDEIDDVMQLAKVVVISAANKHAASAQRQ